MSEGRFDPQQLMEPELQPQRRWGLSLVWLVPLIAVLAGLVLMARAWLASGPEISIRFATAEGLEAGKTEVRYKNVVVGKVRRIRLAEDRETVQVKVELTRDAANLAVSDSRFWIVRPRVGLGGVTGLATLISGAYIGVDVGHSQEREDEFDGLEVPPAVTHDQKGRRYLLDANDLGSLDIGAPVYFRRVQVGRVVGYQLREDGRGVTIEIFVDAPHDRYVTRNTRFWNASGIDVSLSAAGFKLDTESLVTLLAGGVAFEAPALESSGAVADENERFALFGTRETALAPFDGIALDMRMRFKQSIRGLAIGAPVDFRGITLGTVTATRLAYDAKAHGLISIVDARVYPERLGPLVRDDLSREGRDEKALRGFFTRLVGDGLRAQLRPGNLLTGQLFVALDIDRKARAVTLDPQAEPFELPTAAGGIDEIQQQIASIVAKIDQVPFDTIGRNLDSTLRSADQVLKRVDTELAPEARTLLVEARAALAAAERNLLADDAPVQRDAQATLESLERMARAMRELADYLQRHPQSLLRGRPDTDPVPLVVPAPAPAPAAIAEPASENRAP